MSQTGGDFVAGAAQEQPLGTRQLNSWYQVMENSVEQTTGLGSKKDRDCMISC